MTTETTPNDGVTRRSVVKAGAAAVGSLGLAAPAGAKSKNTGDFDYLFGSALDPLLPLVGLSPLGDCVTMAKDGSRIETTGQGTFSIGGGPKSVSGSGSYTVFDPSGAVATSGAWEATHLRGYTDYGGMDVSGQDWRGGKLTLSVHLETLGKGKLTLHCLIGDPPSSKEEGVHVGAGSMHFKDSVEPPDAGATLIRRLP